MDFSFVRFRTSGHRVRIGFSRVSTAVCFGRRADPAGPGARAQPAAGAHPYPDPQLGRLPAARQVQPAYQVRPPSLCPLP